MTIVYFITNYLHLHEGAQGQEEEEENLVPEAGRLLWLWPQLPEFCIQNPRNSSANLNKNSITSLMPI